MTATIRYEHEARDAMKTLHAKHPVWGYRRHRCYLAMKRCEMPERWVRDELRAIKAGKSYSDEA